MAFEYVEKKEVGIARKEIESVIHNVQNELKGILTFQFNLVGSASNNRHLVTRIINGNQGFDLDFNIIIQRMDENYDDAKTIKLLFMKTFNKFLENDFKPCEDSSTVFTIKKVNKKTKKIIYSFDFAIVNYYEEKIANNDYDDDYDNPDEEFFVVERQELIKFNKPNSYVWETRSIASDHRYTEQFIKENGLWNELRDQYIINKNNHQNKKSRIVYYNTLNQIFQKYHIVK